MKKKLLAVALAASLFTALPLTAMAAESTLLGDANGDGTVSIADVTMIQRASAEVVTLTDAQKKAADVNGDGAVDISDATLIQQYLADLKTGYAIGEPIEEETTPTAEPTTEVTTAAPTTEPTEATTVAPTTEPTEATTVASTTEPVETPTAAPTTEPTEATTAAPTTEPTTATEPTEPTTVSEDAWKENTGVITLSNDGITVTGEGISVEGSVVTITEGGDWEVVGTCDDGMIYINTGEEKDANDKVKLRLNGMSLTNSNGPAIYFDRCKKAFITLESGTVNTVSDGASYSEAYADAKGAIQSDDSLEIKGKGSLTVNGNYKHGISSSDDIVIENGTFNITSVKDGIHANDYVVLDGKNINLTVSAQGDGIESEGYLTVDKAKLNLTGGGKGLNAADYITLTSGAYTIDTTDDCINSNAAVTIADGTYDLTSGDEAITGDTINISDGAFTLKTTGKGVKATTDMTLSGGEFTINSSDDSIHSNGNITVTGGSYTITSGDDGVHADSTLTIEDGSITVTKSYEGLEANDIIINGGTMYVTASDDGVNAAGGQDQSSQGGRPGQNNFNPGAPGGSASNASITVNGGYLFVVASGDGVDSNGSLSFNGGTTIVQGPSTGGNFAIDADGTVGFNGGTVMAVCSSNAMWEDINGKLGNAVYTKSAGSVQKNGVIAVTDASGNVLSAVKSQISGSIGVLYYNSSVSSLTSCKSFVGGTYSGSFDSFGYAEGGTISGGTSTALSQTSTGGGGRPGGPGGRF